jgi:hypothetical protein
MSSHIVRGLQHLKRELKSNKLGEFEELEEQILNLLHLQSLFPEQDELEEELAKQLQKCDVLARACTSYTLNDLCMRQPARRSSFGVASPGTRSVLEAISQNTDLPDVRLELLTYQVPSSYCYQKNANAKDYPLATLIIDTTHLQQACTAIIDVYFCGFGSPTPHTMTFPAGKVVRKEFLPVIAKQRLKQINTKSPDTIRVDMHYLNPKGALWRESRQVYLLPYNTAMLWRYEWDRSMHFYTEYLAGWVTPQARQVQKLFGDALKYHPDQAFYGYNSPSFLSKEVQKQEVRKIVRAFFEVLHRELNIRYATSALFTPSASEPNMQYIQWIRLPEDIIDAGGPANCIDGSILFASLLELASLHPVLLLRPKHALVGWRVAEGSAEYEFLETTLIAHGNFEQACQDGQRQYTEVLFQGLLDKKPRFFCEDFAILIDIEQCRKQDIMAM